MERIKTMEIVSAKVKGIFNSEKKRETKELGKKITLLKTIFGCRHEDLGRPMTINGISYRSCAKCGARQYFDAKTLERTEGFYMPPPELIGEKIY